MDVIVCVKQIPDPVLEQSLEPGSFTLKRDSKLILDESDRYGVEMGLLLVEQAGGGQVTLVSMAPNNEVSGIRDALAMGANGAILISDPKLKGTGALGTAKVLASAIRRNPFDLIIAATESTDGYTGTMPVQLAELLSIPSVTFAKKVSLEGNVLKVQRQTEAGFDEVECPLPALITVTAGVVEPRFPSFKGIMSAKSKPVEELDISKLSIPESVVGQTGSRQKILEAVPAPSRQSGQIFEDDGTGHEKIIEFLESLKVI